MEKVSLRDEISSLEGSTILLVEDNILNQKIITGILKSSGINIDIASNGVECIEKFKSKGSIYELILMDIQMPLMNGYEATKLIRDIDKNVPIISFSADTSEEDELYSKILGMNDSLTKPIDTEKLCAILLKYIPKKMEIKNNNMNFEEETIPQLEYLNIKKVVPSTLSSFSFYKCIALRFLEQYKNLKLNPELESFNETIYTLKGLSGTLGAEQLFEVITKLERNQSEELLNLFHKILELVCNEIRINFYNDENLVLCELKREISQEELKNLFEELKEVLKTKRPKTIHLVLVKFKEIVLNEDMDKLFSQVVKYLQEYEFDLAIKLIDGFIDN